MKSHKNIFVSALAAAALSAGAWAQPGGPAAQPSEVIYLPQLPSPADLSQGAAAHGQTIGRIEQTGNRVIAVYNGPNGQTMTVDYELLPSQPAPSGQVATPTPAPEIYAQQPQTYAPPAVETAPANTVVYDTAPGYAGYPYDYYPYGYYPYGYYPYASSWPWYPAFGIGFGFRYGFGYHYGYGGYRGFGHPIARGYGYHYGSAYRGGGYHGGGGYHSGGGYHGGGGSHR